MKGILEKKEECWFVKWSDLHSFGNGTHWILTPLQPINVIDETKLKDGDVVEFNIIIEGYEEKNCSPIYSAKIIVDVDNINISEKFDLSIFDLKNFILKRISEHTEDIIKYEILYNNTKNEMYIDYKKNYSIRRSELNSILQLFTNKRTR